MTNWFPVILLILGFVASSYGMKYVKRPRSLASFWKMMFAAIILHSLISIISILGENIEPKGLVWAGAIGAIFYGIALLQLGQALLGMEFFTSDAEQTREGKDAGDDDSTVRWPDEK